MVVPAQEPTQSKRRRVSFTTILILLLAGLAGVTYYLGTPALQPSVTPASSSCAGAARIVVDNGANSSARYQPPPITVVVGVNNTVAWVDEDQGFELHVISVAVPGGHQWDLNMTQGQTECVLLTAPGTYTYEMFVPYVVAGTITVKGATA